MPKAPKAAKPDIGLKHSAPFSFDGTKIDFFMKYPFASRIEAAAAAHPGEEVYAGLAYFDDKDMAVHQRATAYAGPRKKADMVGKPFERWALRAAHEAKPKTDAPVAKPSVTPKAPVVPAAPTRKSIVRDLLLTGKPVALETLMERWGCTKGAASALISDVRHMGYTVDKRPDGTFEIPTGGKGFVGRGK